MPKITKKLKMHAVRFNVLMNMILTSSSFLFPLITVPYVSRVLSTRGTGLVAFAQSVSSYFSLVALLGITTYGVRACAQVRNDRAALSKTVKELLVILGVSTTLVSLVYIGCLLLVPQFRSESMLFIEFGFTIWLASFGVEWFYQALEQYGYITIRNIVFKVVGLVLMFIFVHELSDYVIYGAITVVAGFGSNILNIFRLRKLIDFRDKQKLEIRRHFKPMRWFMIAAVSSGMYTQVDIVLLGFLGTPQLVGLYQLVVKIKVVLVSAVNSVGNVMLPRLSYYRKINKQQEADRLIAKNLNFVMIMGGAIVCLLIICASPIVLLMGGSDFAASAFPLSIIGVAVLFSAMNIVIGNHLISKNLERQWASVNVIGLITAVILNVVLMPSLGIAGSALSIALCEVFMFVMRCYVVRDFLKTLSHEIDPLKIFVCLIVASLITWGGLSIMHISGSFLNLVTAAFIFGLAYAVMLLVVRERFVMDMVQPILRKLRRVHQ